MPGLLDPGMTHRPQQPMGQKGQAVMQYMDDVMSGRVAEQGMRQYGDAVRSGMVGDYRAFGGLLGDAMGGGFAVKGLLGLPGMIGKTVWHGSPHKWDVPDISKVGTGEGAQAYGHGFYSAEASDVAKSYKEGLSKVSISGRGVNYEDPAEVAAEAIYLSGGDIPGAADKLYRDGKNRVSANPKTASEAAYLLDDLWKQGKRGKELINKLPQIESGHLYKLDIPDEDIPKYLDWDKPLSEQPEEVRKALGGILDGELTAHKRWLEIRDEMDSIWDSVGGSSGLDANPSMARKWRKLGDEAETLTDKYSLVTFPDDIESFNSMKGQDLHDYMQKFGDQKEASEQLQSLGIPGIRYLDGSSRGAGEGTYNYVTFDPSRIKVLERK